MRSSTFLMTAENYAPVPKTRTVTSGNASVGPWFLPGMPHSDTSQVLEVIAPTINYQCGDIAAIPVILDTQKEAEINALVEENIRLSREDWDSFEISWDFFRHPLV